MAALDKLAADPPLLGVFVPKCKPDGHYEDEQCHELFCWCVDKDGRKISDTSVRGSAVCLRQGKMSAADRSNILYIILLNIIYSGCTSSSRFTYTVMSLPQFKKGS